MNTVILFVENSYDWSPEKWITENGGKKTDYGRVVIEESNAWLIVDRYNQFVGDYDEDEKQYVSNLLKNPIGYIIEWKGESLLEKFITNVPSESKAVIDNDHGLICLVEDIKSLPLTSWIKANNL